VAPLVALVPDACTDQTPITGTGKRTRFIILYWGIHYGAVTLVSTKHAPEEWHQTLFLVVSAAFPPYFPFPFLYPKACEVMDHFPSSTFNGRFSSCSSNFLPTLLQNILSLYSSVKIEALIIRVRLQLDLLPRHQPLPPSSRINRR